LAKNIKHGIFLLTRLSKNGILAAIEHTIFTYKEPENGNNLKFCLAKVQTTFTKETIIVAMI